MNTQPFRAARGCHPATRRRQMVGRITSIVLPDKNGVKREPNIGNNRPGRRAHPGAPRTPAVL